VYFDSQIMLAFDVKMSFQFGQPFKNYTIFKFKPLKKCDECISFVL